MSTKQKPSIDCWKDAVGAVTGMGAAAYRLPKADKDIVGSFTGAAQRVLVSYLDMNEHVAGILLSKVKGDARTARISQATEHGIGKITAAAADLSAVCRTVAGKLPQLDLPGLAQDLDQLVEQEQQGQTRAAGDAEFMKRVSGQTGMSTGRRRKAPALS